MQRLYSQFNTFIIHPLIPITICLMLGIWYAHGTSNLFLMLSGLGMCCILHAITAQTVRLLCTALAYSCIAFLLGAALAQHQHSKHAQLATSLNSGPYEAIAQVSSIGISDKKRHPYTIECKLIKQKQSLNTATWQTNNAVIALYCNRLPSLKPDDVVYLENITLSSYNPKTSFNDYLIKSGIHGTVFCHHLKYTLLQRPTYSYKRGITNLRTNIFERIQAKMSKSCAAFYASLFLGNCQKHKTYLKEMKSHFGMWGLSHFLARSGLHLILFIFLWHWLLGYIPIHSRKKYSIMLLLNTVYLLLSWSSLSFIRSFASLCLYYCAHIWQQQSSTLHTITLLSGMCLLINPMQLFFLDFQLSFGLTFALAWIYQVYAWHQLKLTTNS